MEKRSVVLLLVLCVLSSGPALAAEEDVRNKQMKYSITPVNNVSGDGFYCVNETLRVYVINPYIPPSQRALAGVHIQIMYNYTTRFGGVYTTMTGNAEFTPNQSGKYSLYMTRVGYSSERTSFDVSICTTTTTTTTSTTATTTTTTTTTTTSTTTTTTTTTTLAPTCDDGLRNQDEEGVDCGGPCKACASLNLEIFIAAILLICFAAVVAYFIMSKKRQSGKKEEKAEKKPKQGKKTKLEG